MQISKQLGPVLVSLGLSEGALVQTASLPIISLLDEAVAAAEVKINNAVAKEVIDMVYGAIKAELIGKLSQ